MCVAVKDNHVCRAGDVNNDFDCLQLKESTSQCFAGRLPYIGNHSRKKVFADFASLGAFANIFLYYFLLITKNSKFADIFLQTL